jgi:hypothetical protein
VWVGGAGSMPTGAPPGAVTLAATGSDGDVVVPVDAVPVPITPSTLTMRMRVVPTLERSEPSDAR